MHLDLTYNYNNFRVQNTNYKHFYLDFTKTFGPTKIYTGLDDEKEYEYNDIYKIIISECEDIELNNFPTNLKVFKMYNSKVEKIINLPESLEEILIDNCENLEYLNISNLVNLKKIIIVKTKLNKLYPNKLNNLNYIKFINTNINKEEFIENINLENIKFLMIKNENLIPLELSYKPTKINI